MAEKTSKGKQRIEMKKIENEGHLRVAFTKRRGGLFKKAGELSTLTGAELAVIAFSPSGKPFSYGSPSVEHVLDQLRHGGSSGGAAIGGDGGGDPIGGDGGGAPIGGDGGESPIGGDGGGSPFGGDGGGAPIGGNGGGAPIGGNGGGAPIGGNGGGAPIGGDGGGAPIGGDGGGAPIGGDGGGAAIGGEFLTWIGEQQTAKKKRAEVAAERAQKRAEEDQSMGLPELIQMKQAGEVFERRVAEFYASRMVATAAGNSQTFNGGGGIIMFAAGSSSVPFADDPAAAGPSPADGGAAWFVSGDGGFRTGPGGPI